MLLEGSSIDELLARVRAEERVVARDLGEEEHQRADEERVEAGRGTHDSDSSFYSAICRVLMSQ